MTSQETTHCNEPAIKAINETVNVLQNIQCPYQQELKHHLIVITDTAPITETNNVEALINDANDLQIQIHFLFFNSKCSVDFSLYEKIAVATVGIQGELSSDDSYDLILSSIKTITPSLCSNFTISERVSLLTVYIKTTEVAVLVTTPNKTVERILVPDNYIEKQYHAPSAGEWEICVSTGEIQTTFHVEEGIP